MKKINSSPEFWRLCATGGSPDHFDSIGDVLLWIFAPRYEVNCGGKNPARKDIYKEYKGKYYLQGKRYEYDLTKSKLTEVGY